MELGQEDTNGGTSTSQILTEEITKYGTVSLLFYIPEAAKDRDTMVKLIKMNGGNIVDFHECFTYQIGTPNNTKEEDYYPGTVYSFQWIVDSIEGKKLADNTKYIIANYQNGKDFPFNKKKIKYTVREIIIIYTWISGRKSQASRKTWESLGNEGILYCRSRESLKNFWKKWRKESLDEWIEQMLEKDTKYSHNYSKPVKPHQPIEEEVKIVKKRAKSEVSKQDIDEAMEEGEDGVAQGKQLLKRKLKKKKIEPTKDAESDRVKTNEHKTQKIEEIKEVEDIIGMDEGEDDNTPEMNIDVEVNSEPDVEIEENNDNSKEDKKEAQRAKKPDIPLETNSVEGVIEGSRHSSDLGFPSLGAESEDGGDS